MDTSRFFKNPYPDYSTATNQFVVSNQLKDVLVSQIKTLEGTLFSKLENFVKQISPREDHTVYTGYSGVAYLYILKYKKTGDGNHLHLAKELIDKALSRLAGRDLSFLLGDAGPLALGAFIYHELQDVKFSNDLINRLVDLPQRVRAPPYEVLYGFAGYLYALLYLRKEVGSVVLDDAIKQVVQIIIFGGIQKSKSEKFPAPLLYEWYETNYLGAAHGVSGILYMLLCANDFLTDQERNEIIKPTIDWLSANRFASGNFKTNAGRDEDILVHWCHGSPGMVHLYLLASKIYNSAEYLNIALQCGDVVWQRGLLKKGYSICHGVSGNAYTFVQLFQATGDIKHLYRLACFADWCLTYPDQQRKKPDSPYSLFEGIAGLDYFLTDCQDVSNASFPAFTV